MERQMTDRGENAWALAMTLGFAGCLVAVVAVVLAFIHRDAAIVTTWVAIGLAVASIVPGVVFLREGP